MEAFKKWLSTIPTTDMTLQEIAMFDLGAIRAWVAALEWTKKEAISLDERGESSRNVINRELNNQ